MCALDLPTSSPWLWGLSFRDRVVSSVDALGGGGAGGFLLGGFGLDAGGGGGGGEEDAVFELTVLDGAVVDIIVVGRLSLSSNPFPSGDAMKIHCSKYSHTQTTSTIHTHTHTYIH